MTWHKTDGLSRRSIAQKGLDGIVMATQTCETAEALAPVPVRAVSARNGVLHLAITKDRLMQFRMAQTGFIEAVNKVCYAKRMQIITRVRLTIEPGSGTLVSNDS